MTSRDPDKKGMELSGVVDYGAKLDQYEWTQDRVSVTCTITKDQLARYTGRDASLPITARDFIIQMTLTHLKCSLKGAPKPFFDADFYNRINTDDSTWTWDSETNILEFTLSKDMTVHDSEEPWWASFLKGHEEIDVEFIKASKHLDVSLLRRIKAEKAMKKANAEAQAETDAKAAAARAASVQQDEQNKND